MQKRKLFIILAAIIIISLIGLSAQCGIGTTGEAPAIELEIYDGPNYSASDDMCIYFVAAIPIPESLATGRPEPEIDFSKDDNVEALGSGIVKVYVAAGELYTLTATATNRYGTASVSVVLEGECEEGEPGDEEPGEGPEEDDTDSDADKEPGDEEDEEDDDAGDGDGDGDGDGEVPTISLAVYEGPTLSGTICYSRVEATVTGSPTVSFSKDDSGGAWLPNKVQININNPGNTYTLTATATNSAGSATDSITLSWGCEIPEPEPEPEPEADETSIAADPDISGYLWDFGSINLTTPNAYMGDSDLDYYAKSYLSFDIRGLHGKTVQDAEINFTGIRGYGNPESFASSIVVKVDNYVRLDTSDFAMGGVHLADIPISATSYIVSGNTLKNELQDVLDNSVRDYFQLKLGLNATTNNDGIGDGIMINWNEAVLHISYTD